MSSSFRPIEKVIRGGFACAVKRPARLAVALAVAALCCAPFTLQRASAGDRFRAVRFESGLTVVPFAVPVATPVAVLGPAQVFYGYAPRPPAASTAAASDATDPQLLVEFEAFRRWRDSQRASSDRDSAVGDSTANPAQPTMPLVAAHCLKCHSGPQAKGEFRLDGDLTGERRLAAIRAALAGEMPKDKPLSSDDLGPLLYELSQPRPGVSGEE
jgi:hypothetical protein